MGDNVRSEYLAGACNPYGAVLFIIPRSSERGLCLKNNNHKVIAVLFEQLKEFGFGDVFVVGRNKLSGFLGDGCVSAFSCKGLLGFMELGLRNLTVCI